MLVFSALPFIFETLALISHTMGSELAMPLGHLEA